MSIFGNADFCKPPEMPGKRGPLKITVNGHECPDAIRIRQYNHNMDKVVFYLPRYYNDVDLSVLTVKIIVGNVDVAISGVNDVLSIREAGTEVAITWIVQGSSTRIEGIVPCQIVFTNSEVQIAHTQTFLMNVDQSLGIQEVIPEGKITLLEQYLAMFNAIRNDAVGKVDAATEEDL